MCLGSGVSRALNKSLQADLRRLRQALYVMNKRTWIALIALLTIGDAWSGEGWGPEIIEFQLESTDKIETMIWISGFSYSSSEILSSVGCFDKPVLVASKELIQAINAKYSGETITSEQATVVLGEYLRSEYSCPAYNKAKQ